MTMQWSPCVQVSNIMVAGTSAQDHIIFAPWREQILILEMTISPDLTQFLNVLRLPLSLDPTIWATNSTLNHFTVIDVYEVDGSRFSDSDRWSMPSSPWKLHIVWRKKKVVQEIVAQATDSLTTSFFSLQLCPVMLVEVITFFHQSNLLHYISHTRLVWQEHF